VIYVRGFFGTCVPDLATHLRERHRRAIPFLPFRLRLQTAALVSPLHASAGTVTSRGPRRTMVDVMFRAESGSVLRTQIPAREANLLPALPAAQALARFALSWVRFFLIRYLMSLTPA